MPAAVPIVNWGDKDREQILCCRIFTGFQMVDAQQKVCEEKHFTTKVTAITIAYSLSSFLLKLTSSVRGDNMTEL